MKIVIGLYSPENAIKTIRLLIENGYRHEDISMMSSASNMPTYLEAEEPEESAAKGATVGAVVGSGAGVAGGMALATILPNFEIMVMSGLVTTALGGVVGGYLGSLYTLLAEDQTKINVQEAFEEGKVLVVVKIDEAQAETAVTLMNENNGEHIEVREVSLEKVQADEQMQSATSTTTTM